MARRIILLLIGLIFTVSVNSEKIPDSVGHNIITQKQNSYVLIVNCHIESISWRNNYEDEIIKYINTNKKMDVYVEHVLSLDITDMNKLETKRRELLRKYTKRPAVIVFIGPASYMLFAETFNNRWKNVNMLFLGPMEMRTSLDDLIYQRDMDIAKFTKASAYKMQKECNVTGIWVHFFVRQTIDLMKKTIKGMNRIVLIGDNRQGCLIAKIQTKEEVSKHFPELKLEYLSPDKISTNVLLKKISSYDSHTGILFHSWFIKGSDTEKY